MYPEINEYIDELFLMGGNYQGMGNKTICAEFNFYMDPEAAYIVLNSVKFPMTILPLESCSDENLNIPIVCKITFLLLHYNSILTNNDVFFAGMALSTFSCPPL